MTNEIMEAYISTLDLAIKKEQDSYAFYKQAMELVKNPGLKDFFAYLVSEEVRHEKILSEFKDRVKTDQDFHQESLRIQDDRDLGLSKYLVIEGLEENSTYQDALILAMKREETAVTLFTDLEAVTPHPDLKKVFSKLKVEEIRHLRSLEERYDEDILTEN